MHFLFDSATTLILNRFKIQPDHSRVSGPVLEDVELFPQIEESLP